MPYFRVDDGLHCHPKALIAGNAALGLWTRCGSFCGQQNTGGKVPTEIAKAYGTRGEIARLVLAGLWIPVDGGYQMHDWTDHNYTVEQVKEQRAKAAERQREKRERDAARSRRDSQRDTPRDERRESHAPDQTRPNQTIALEYSIDDDSAVQVAPSSSSIDELPAAKTGAAALIARAAAVIIDSRRTDVTAHTPFINSTARNLLDERRPELEALAQRRGAPIQALALELLDGSPPPAPHRHDPECPYCLGEGLRPDTVDEHGEPAPGARWHYCDCTEPERAAASVTNLETRRNTA